VGSHREVRILCMGDSNTWGAGNPDLARDPATTVGYRQELVRLLAERGIRARMVGAQSSGAAVMARPHHEGWPGKGINTLVWRVRVGVLEKWRPDVVLLLIGSNNLWRSMTDRRPVRPLWAWYWVARLVRLVVAISRRAPQAWVLLGQPVTPADAGRALRIYRRGIGALGRLLAALGSRVVVVDLDAENDGIHYTPAGHRQVAYLWYRAMLPVLEESREEDA
jgi:lysophospholipase L1-like esterase